MTDERTAERSVTRKFKASLTGLIRSVVGDNGLDVVQLADVVERVATDEFSPDKLLRALVEIEHRRERAASPWCYDSRAGSDLWELVTGEKPAMDETAAAEILEFCCDAELVDEDHIRRFTGTVWLSGWKSTHVTNSRAAAWAFVRKMCDREGEWSCDVRCPGESLEHRTIDVAVIDEVIFRTDRAITDRSKE